MKKHLLFIFAVVFFAFSINAQISVSSTDVVDIGAISFRGYDTIPDASIMPGNAGANQSWDFSALVAHNHDTLSFVDPATTPYDANISGDNTAVYMANDDIWAYFNKNTADLQVMGFVGDIFGTGAVTTVQFNPSETLIKFPANYQDVLVDTSSLELIIDTIKVVQTTYKTVDIDAWGSIVIPLGTYDALRFNITKIENQDIYLDVFGNWVLIQSQVDTVYSYEWWSNDVNIGLPLVSFDWNVDSMAIDGDVEFAEFVNNVSAQNINNFSENVSVFPNPVQDVLHISGDVVSVEIININGEKIYSMEFVDTNNKTIDMGNNPKGIYLLRLKTKDNKIITKKLILN